MRAALLAAVALILATGTSSATCDTARPATCNPTQMQVIDLGGIGSPAGPTVVLALNDKGESVGYGWSATEPSHALAWSATGQMTDYGTIDPIPNDPQADAYATGINDAGDIVGWYYYKPQGVALQHPFLIRNGKILRIGSPNSVAVAINKGGTVLLDNAGGVTAIWNKGVTTTIVTPVLAAGVAINDMGEVVGAKGYYPPDRQSEAYILAQPGGGPVIIAPDGVPSALNAVNNTGEAVGWADKLILLYRNGKVLRRSGPAGSAWAVATGVNGSGMVVGYYRRETKPVLGAFLMEPDGTFYDLAALYGLASDNIDWVNVAINDSGWIAAEMIVNGQQNGALLVWQ